MVYIKKGSNFVLFWSIIFLILIVFVVLAFFFMDFFKLKEINYFQVGEDDVSLRIGDFKEKRGGVEFNLDINAKQKEITNVKFTFYSVKNITEVYEKDVSYKCKMEEPFSMDLHKMHPSEVSKIVIEPTTIDLDNTFNCVPEMNVSESLSRSKGFVEKVISKFKKD